jgi:hypothetical protein
MKFTLTVVEVILILGRNVHLEIRSARIRNGLCPPITLMHKVITELLLVRRSIYGQTALFVESTPSIVSECPSQEADCFETFRGGQKKKIGAQGLFVIE